VHHHRNIVLIGMPGAGKSTVGVILAKSLGMRFIDTDILIQERTGRMLQAILDEDGPEGSGGSRRRRSSPFTPSTR